MSDDYGCAQCGAQFRTLTDFDRHQDVDYGRPHAQMVLCKPPAELGLVQDAGGPWCTPEGLKARQGLSTRLARANRERAR